MDLNFGFQWMFFLQQLVYTNIEIKYARTPETIYVLSLQNIISLLIKKLSVSIIFTYRSRRDVTKFRFFVELTPDEMTKLSI